jgi:hypothetical protein
VRPLVDLGLVTGSSQNVRRSTARVWSTRCLTEAVVSSKFQWTWSRVCDRFGGSSSPTPIDAAIQPAGPQCAPPETRRSSASITAVVPVASSTAIGGATRPMNRYAPIQSPSATTAKVRPTDVHSPHSSRTGSPIASSGSTRPAASRAIVRPTT